MIVFVPSARERRSDCLHSGSTLRWPMTSVAESQFTYHIAKRRAASSHRVHYPGNPYVKRHEIVRLNQQESCLPNLKLMFLGFGMLLVAGQGSAAEWMRIWTTVLSLVRVISEAWVTGDVEVNVRYITLLPSECLSLLPYFYHLSTISILPWILLPRLKITLNCSSLLQKKSKKITAIMQIKNIFVLALASFAVVSSSLASYHESSNIYLGRHLRQDCRWIWWHRRRHRERLQWHNFRRKRLLVFN